MTESIAFMPATLILTLVSCFLSSQDLKPIPVELKKTNNQWQLIRDGKPYFVKGAGGDGPLDLLAQCGGNSTRTWGVGPDTMKRLDDAHAMGISVALGIWLEHESCGFDYQDYDQVTYQIEKVMAAVRKYKNHPAVLVWGIGNEMEGYQAGDNPAIWSHVEHLCGLIKKEDPHHPTMTVIAEIGGNRIPAIHEFCPSVDIIGINSYGGAASIPKRYQECGGRKPYIVTEFGPAGPWEVARDNINAVTEPFSNVKAMKYRDSYLGIVADKSNCLGTYAFLWGQKMEATTTWFGMLLADGRRTNMVDTMSELWTGARPKNCSPEIDSLKITTPNQVDPGETVVLELAAHDPDDDSLIVQWQLLPEADAYITAGDYKPNPSPIKDSTIESDSKSVKIKAPSKPGYYRVYSLVGDGNGSVATANLAFQVKFQPLERPGIKTALPIVVYDETDSQSIFDKLAIDETSEDCLIEMDHQQQAKFGQSCIHLNIPANVITRARLTDQQGFDLMGAKRLFFWAKGTTGRESVVVGLGHSVEDTFHKRKSVPLTKFWKKYQLDFANSDLRRIGTGFFWELKSTGSVTEIYLDRITIE